MGKGYGPYLLMMYVWKFEISESLIKRLGRPGMWHTRYVAGRTEQAAVRDLAKMLELDELPAGTYNVVGVRSVMSDIFEKRGKQDG